MAGKPETKPEEAAAAKPAAPSGGLKTWLPLIANLILMPVMGYLTISFLAPKAHKPATAAEAKAGVREKTEAKGEKTEAKGEKKEKGGEGDAEARRLVPLSANVVVNLQNTQMSRLLMARVVLEGDSADLEALVKKHDFELRDVAGGVLQTKSIQDLDKPDARNLIRAELLTVFRSVLGQDAVKQVWLPEFAVQ